MADKAKHLNIGLIDQESGKVIYVFLKDRKDPSKYRTYPLKPEEEIRFLLVARLIEEYGYAPEQIDLEVEIQAGQKTLPKRADIVIFRNGRNKDPHSNAYIICEVKKKDRKDGVEQLETYMNNTTAEFGIWWNGTDIVYLHRLREPHKFEEIPDIPRKGETLEDVGTWDKKDLKPATELIKVFDTIHNHIYANEGLLKEKVFNEMLKFIFMKMVDEKLPDEKPYFRITSKELEEVNEGKGNSFRQRIETLWQRVIKEYGDVFDENERINLKLTTQAFIVSQLQRYSFTRTPADVKGVAFQTFVYAHQRGERGEFFTPHPVVELMVKMMDPSDGESIIDPAVGSAGLLVKAMLHVWEKIDKAKHLNEVEKKERKYTFARYYIRGIDINPDLAKVAKMHMVVYDDGHTGIFCANSLIDFEELKRLAVDYGAVRITENLKESFDVLLTNPPFGSKGKVTDKKILQQYDLGYKWKKNKKSGRWIKTDKLLDGQTPEILFVERSLQFLKPYGRMAIVLPDGILSNSSLEYVRQWIMDHARVLAVVSLPPETFIPFGSGPKASVLFLQKLPKEELKKLKKEGYEIFFASVKKIGYDVRGREIYKRDEKGEIIKDEEGIPIIDTDVPNVIEAFKAFRIKKNLIFNQKNQETLYLLDEDLIAESEFTEISSKEAEKRLDVGYFNPKAITIIKQLKKIPSKFLGELVNFKTSAFYESIALNYLSYGIPFIRVSDIDTSTLTIKTESLVFLSPLLKIKGISEITAGNFVITKGGTVANIALLPSHYQSYRLSRDIIGVVVKDKRLAPFLVVFLASKYGKAQLERGKSQQVQPHLTLEPLKKIIVPLTDQQNIVEKIDNLIEQAHILKEQAVEKYKKAEKLLNEALGIGDLELKDELSYTASNKDVETSGILRFDADFYQPKYFEVLNLVKNGYILKDIAIISEDTIDPTQTPAQKFKYISLRSINGATGEIEEIEEFLGWQAPSRARMLVKENDVLVSSLKGSLDKVGLVPEELNGALASTGFFVVREKNRDYPAEVLFMLFRNPILSLQMEKLSSGAILEAVSKSAFKRLRVPAIKNKTLISTIVNLVKEHFKLRKEARSLIQEAINSIELEIERLIRNASSGTS